MKKFVFLILMMFVPFVVGAYEVNLEWKKTYEGEGHDRIKVVIDDGNGGFVALGTTNLDKYSSYSSQDTFIAKFDSEGNIIWRNDFFGSSGDSLNDIIKLNDNNYIVVGSTYSNDIEGIVNNGESDAILLKYDNSGNLLWKKNFGGAKRDFFSKLYSLNDGFIVCGSFNSDSFLGINKIGSDDKVFIKFDFDGNIIWQNSWGKPVLEAGNHSYLIEDNIDVDGNLIAVGSNVKNIDDENNIYDYDGVVVKYDKNGQLLWEKDYHLDGSELFNSFVLEDDGSIICFGEIEYFDYNNGKDPDGYHGIIVKYDKDGNLIWEKDWISKNSDLAESLGKTIKLSNGNYLAIGYLTDQVCDTDCYTFLLQFDSDGNLVYENKLGNNASGGNGVQINTFHGNDNGYFVSYSGSLDLVNETGAYILRYDNDGNLSNYYKFSEIDSSCADDLLYLDDGGLLLNYRFYSSDDWLADSNYAFYKYSFIYDLDVIKTSNGNVISNQHGFLGSVVPTPEEGYEVDEVIVKDSVGNILEVSLQSDGTYTFDLYDDVNIKVTFKEILTNPKTGMFDHYLFVIMILLVSSVLYFYVKMNNTNIEI